MCIGSQKQAIPPSIWAQSLANVFYWEVLTSSETARAWAVRDTVVSLQDREVWRMSVGELGKFRKTMPQSILHRRVQNGVSSTMLLDTVWSLGCLITSGIETLPCPSSPYPQNKAQAGHSKSSLPSYWPQWQHPQIHFASLEDFESLY